MSKCLEMANQHGYQTYMHQLCKHWMPSRKLYPERRLIGLDEDRKIKGIHAVSTL